MALRRGVGIVLTLIGLAVVVSVAGLLLTMLTFGSEPSIGRNATLVLGVSGGLEETEPSGLLSQVVGAPPTVRALVDSLRKAKVDSRIKGVLLVPKGAQALWAKAQEVRNAVLDFKKSGKPIVAFLEYGGDQEYYLASACDRIFLLPTSPLDLTGLASYEVFFRGTLDKIGAYPDLLHIGEYKTAANTFTKTGFTPAHREMAESLNRDLFDQLVTGIAEARKKDEADVRALIDRGPFLPEDALREGLVDDLAYEDELDDKVKIGSGKLERLKGDDYARVGLMSLGLNRGQRIALIYAVGVINQGESNSDTGSAVVGSDTFVKYLRKVREDDSIKAVVLRIDSPGGSAVASDIIWREVLLTREKKPVIASMSDLAASGGYYIAMPAHTIVAQPATLTGSIGIVIGKFTTGGTFKKLGANIEAVSSGKQAEINSPTRPYNATERAKIEEQMQAFYDGFVEKAAEGRHTSPERIDSVAQGRVWTGRQAKDVGLVDELGGLDRAIAIAKTRIGVAADADVEIVVYPPKRSFFEALREPLGTDAMSRATFGLSAEERRVFTALTSPFRLFRRGEPLALMPNFFLR